MEQQTTVTGLTSKRRAVLEAVRQSKGHLTAADIWERARGLEPKISFATVYNAVHYLCDSGLLVEIPFGDGASLYDARTDRHDHAKCTRCGGIVDYDCGVATDVIKQVALEKGFLADEVHITVVGLCALCRASN
jgi:Fur family transcriptional regulator, peroxide stress response regulator